MRKKMAALPTATAVINELHYNLNLTLPDTHPVPNCSSPIGYTVANDKLSLLYLLR